LEKGKWWLFNQIIHFMSFPKIRNLQTSNHLINRRNGHFIISIVILRKELFVTSYQNVQINSVTYLNIAISLFFMSFATGFQRTKKYTQTLFVQRNNTYICPQTDIVRTITFIKMLFLPLLSICHPEELRETANLFVPSRFFFGFHSICNIWKI